MKMTSKKKMWLRAKTKVGLGILRERRNEEKDYLMSKSLD